MKCDGCTLCCKMMAIPQMNSPAGEYCRGCFIDIGCCIYDDAPEECLEYACAYAQMNRASIKLRPDNCHVIFEKSTNNIFTGLMEAGYKLNEDVNNQIKSFVDEGISVLLYVFGESTPSIHLAEGRVKEEVLEKVQKT